MTTLAQLQADVAAFTQSFLDTLDAHSVRIDAAQFDADAAQASANSALSQIYTTGLNAQTYTDARIQNLRDELTQLITTTGTNLLAQTNGNITTAVNDYDATNSAQVDAALAWVNATAANLGITANDLTGLYNSLVNIALPDLSAQLTGTDNRLVLTEEQIANLILGYGYESIVEGLDQVVADTTTAIQPLPFSVLRPPIGLWTTQGATTSFSPKLPPTPAEFLTADPILGECYEFPAGTKDIGPAYAQSFDAARVYRLMMRVRATSHGTGSNVTAGFRATTWSAGFPVQTDIGQNENVLLTVPEGERAFYCYVTGNATHLSRLQSQGRSYIDLTGSSTGQQVFFYVRQNPNGVTDGRLLLSALEISDETAAFEQSSDISDLIGDTEPGVPTGLAMSSALISDGNARVTVTWDIPVGDDVFSHDLEMTQNGGNPIVLPVLGSRYEFTTLSGTTLTAKLRAKTRFGTPSAYTTVINHTAAADTIAPPVPSPVSITTGLGAIWLSWPQVVANDLSHYEIFEQASSTPAPGFGTEGQFSSASPSFMRGGLGESVTRHYWVRSVDTSGNKSNWSAISSGTTGTISGGFAATNTPTGLGTSTSLMSDGRAKITVTWNAAVNAAGYELGLNPSGGNEFVVPVGGTNYEFESPPGMSWTIRIRAVNAIGQRSGWTSTTNRTAATDGVAPATTTGLTAAGSFGSVWLTWTPSTATDLSHYEIYESTSTSAPGAGTSPSFISASPILHRSDLAGGLTRHYWVRAVDTSGNKGGWSGRETAVTLDNNAGLTSANLAGLVNAAAFASGLTPIEVVSSLPATGNFAGRQAFLTTTGKLYRHTGSVWTNEVDGADLKLNSITAGSLGVGIINSTHLTTSSAVITGAAQIAGAIINDAHITNLSAAKLVAGSTLSNTILVNGQALGTIQGNAANPASVVNLGSTLIDPGKITISGSTKLSDWRGGPSNTEINGGAIAADSVTANKMTIGNRNIAVEGFDFEHNSPVANRVSWSSGTISWINDSGSVTSSTVNAGQMTSSWTGSVWYIYWVKNSSSLLFTTSAATAFGDDRIVLAIYKGGTNLTATYGKTVIDGSGIKAASITGTQLSTTNAIITGTAQIADAVITEAKISGTLNANKITGNTALLKTITVNDQALDTIQKNANDPAVRVNAASTRIDPGKITISGATTLQDWRKGGDETHIDGGEISANTVTANKMVIGSRNITLTGIEFEHNKPSTNRVAWTAGTVRYINDAGTPTSISISANTAGTLWTSGILYIYWTQGSASLSTTTVQSTAFGLNNIVLATYEGGTKLDADYGRTIIDGGSIKTDTITATQLIKTANVITEAAQMGDLTVDTLTLRGNAVTIPFSLKGSGFLGTGISQWKRLVNIPSYVLDQPANVLMIWSIEQGFVNGAKQWGFKIFRNASTVLSVREPLYFASDFSTGQIYMPNLAAGTYSFQFDWWGEDLSVAAVGTLTLLGVKR